MRPFGPRQPGIRNDVWQAPRLDGLVADVIRCPLLIVHGTADAHVQVAQARSLAAAVPSAQLLEVPGASHLVPLSKHAAEADQRMSDFLLEHAPPSGG